MSLCIKVQGPTRAATRDRALALCGALREAGHQAVPFECTPLQCIKVYTTCASHEAYMEATARRAFVRCGAVVVSDDT